MLLSHCSGFHAEAVDKWTDFKKGYEHSGMDANSNLENSCYVCFNPTSSPSSLAAKSFRAVHLLDASVELSFRLSKFFVVLLEPGMFAHQAVIWDIIGGVLFRKAEHFLVIPESSNYLTLIHDFTMQLSQMQIAPNDLRSRLAMPGSELEELFRTVLALTLVRDLCRTFKLEGRLMAPDLVMAIGDLMRCIPAYRGDWKDSTRINEFLNSFKTIIVDFEMQNAWEVTVIEMYARQAPRRPSKPMALRSRPNRKRVSVTISDSEDEQMLEKLTVKDSTDLVVDNWLQCDKCSKWRIVNTAIAKEFENDPFQCADVGDKTCDDLSDDQAT